MSSDLADQIKSLNTLRALLGEPVYQQKLDDLRSIHGADVINELLASNDHADVPRSRTMNVNAPTDVAVAGDVHGNIYLYGKRGKTEAQLLEGYLRRVVHTCGTMPLQGVREQKSATEVWNISLEQVYTQLATTNLVDRDIMRGDALTVFDANLYLAQHVSAKSLPFDRRESLLIPRRFITAEAAQNVHSHRGIHNDGEVYDLRVMSAKELDRLCRAVVDSGSDGTVFFAGLQLVTEAITINPRLVLLGEPGSGKSTALRYLALTLAQVSLDASVDLAAHLEGWNKLGDQGHLLPVFLPLLPLAKRLAAQSNHRGNADDLWNYIAEHLEANGRAEGLAATVHTELEQGHVLVLLDGLDEVAGTNSRTQVIRAVNAFATQYPQCRMVVACRVRAYEGEQNAAWRLPSWPTATLADWTLGQMEYFIDAWYHAAADASNMTPAKRDDRIAALKRAVNTREDLQRLGVRPLLLTIMALVHLNDGRLPEDRVSLYSRCLDILLGQWEIGGHDATEYGTLMDHIGLPDTDVKSLRLLLSRAALTAHAAATPMSMGRLGRAELREMVADTLASLSHPNPYDGAKRFLEYTDVRAGLLQASDAGDAYAFPHQTFQEYLAGLELVRGVEFVQRVMEKRADDRWRVPIFLGIAHTVSEGVLSASYQLLNRLLRAKKRSETRRQRDLVFAAELAIDIGWDRLEGDGEEFTELRADLARALVSVVEGTALPAVERVKAGVCLGVLGDPRPGVCTLPPAMVPIVGETFVIGSTPADAEQAGKAWEQYWIEQGDNITATSARAWPANEINDQPVTLTSFAIARYPITNAQYALFIAEQGYNQDESWWNIAGKVWLARNDRITENLEAWQRRTSKTQPEYWDSSHIGKGHPNYPVVGISWYEAVAFCRWLTQHTRYNPDHFIYRLPTEAEWEYVARGSSRRVYPWGDTSPDIERANYDQHHASTTTVGCFPNGATPDGVLDIAGNIWEWTGSVYTTYPYNPAGSYAMLDRSVNQGLVIRGSGWGSKGYNLRTATRHPDSPDYYSNDLGFRVVQDPPM